MCFTQTQLFSARWDGCRYCKFLFYANVHLTIFFQGLNTKKGFDVKIATEVSKIIGLEFVTAPNKV